MNTVIEIPPVACGHPLVTVHSHGKRHLVSVSVDNDTGDVNLGIIESFDNEVDYNLFLAGMHSQFENKILELLALAEANGSDDERSASQDSL